jgi:hypothetical protein
MRMGRHFLIGADTTADERVTGDRVHIEGSQETAALIADMQLHVAVLESGRAHSAASTTGEFPEDLPRAARVASAADSMAADSAEAVSTAEAAPMVAAEDADRS